MKKIRKVLSVIMAVMMVLSIVPVSAVAATISGSCGTNVTWSYDTATYTLTISGEGVMSGYKSNNRPWESYEDNIKTVVIGEGVTTIGAYAFYSFGALTSITIPEGIVSIGSKAFYGCKVLANITIPEGVTAIDESAFARAFGTSASALITSARIS